jgi:hypothetical protein
VSRAARVLRAAGQMENLPYTLLAVLALVSLTARLVLICR